MGAIRSPLRYPGGKAKLYDKVRPIVCANRVGNRQVYLEPFAGGAGLALELLFHNDVDSIVINDLDYNIYCFWNSCLNHTDELCELIVTCRINMETWDAQKEIYRLPSVHSTLEVGFATFFLNRCNVSGVLRGGPIGGRAQKGNYLLDARFNREALVGRIRDISQRRDSIDLYNMDATEFMLTVLQDYPHENTFLNIDPPYVRKGPLLYENSFKESDHIALANVIQMLRHPWIVTYDACDLIENLYSDYRKEMVSLHYSVGQEKTGTEFLIYSNAINLPA